MPGDRPNRKWFTYIDSHGTAWNAMGQIDTGCNALDGSAAAVAGQPDRPRAGARYKNRKAIFLDPATLREKTCIIYTEAAGTALGGGSSISVPIPGSGTNITYEFSELLPDRSPVRALSSNKPD